MKGRLLCLKRREIQNLYSLGGVVLVFLGLFLWFLIIFVQLLYPLPPKSEIGEKYDYVLFKLNLLSENMDYLNTTFEVREDSFVYREFLSLKQQEDSIREIVDVYLVDLELNSYLEKRETAIRNRDRFRRGLFLGGVIIFIICFMILRKNS